MKKRFSVNPLIRLAGVVSFVIIWWLVKILFFQSQVFMPSPVFVGKTVITLFTKGNVLVDCYATLAQFFKGFCYAVLAGVPAGLALGYSKKGYAAFEVVIEFFRAIPVTALFPIFILLYGIGQATITAMVTTACFWVILVNSAYGVIYVNPTYLRVMDSLKATTWQKFTQVIAYEALPFILIGLRIAVSFGLIVVIVSEMFIGTERGLGARVYRAHETYLVDEIYALTLIIGLIGYTSNKLLQYLEKKVIHWKGASITFESE